MMKTRWISGRQWACQAALLMGCVQMVSAQTADEVLKQFPDDYAVFSQRRTEVNLTVDQGQVQARQKEQVRMLVLNDKAHGLFNYYVVYHGGYRELKKLSATAEVPMNGRSQTLRVEDMKESSSIDRGIFYDDSRQTEFYLPRLSKGTVAEVNSEFFNKDARVLSPFYFSSYLPSLQSTISISFPKTVKLRYVLRNAKPQDVTVEEDLSGGSHRITLTMKAQRRMESAGGAPRPAYHEPHVLFFVESLEQNGQRQPLLGSLDDLYRFNYEQLRKTNLAQDETLASLADSLTKGLNNAEAKARSIYRWVQGHIKYVAFEDGDNGVVPRQARLVCDRRYGDCKDMAHLLVTLLQHAKVPAYHTWIGTVDIPYDYTDVPSPFTDNHMIAALQLNNRWVFLDATDSHCLFGMPTQGIQGKQALIGLDSARYLVERVPPVAAASNRSVDSTWVRISPNRQDIEGQISSHYSGYASNEFFNGLLNKDSTAARNFARFKLGRASNRFKLLDYQASLPGAAQESAGLRGNYQVPAYVKDVAGELYVNLLLEKMFTNELINVSKRKVAMQMAYAYEVEQHTLLSIPTGMTVSYQPPDAQASSPLLDFAITYKRQGNQLVCTQLVRSKFLLAQAADFEGWNQTLMQLHKAYKENVVLSPEPAKP